MKPFILVAMLASLCSNRSPHACDSRADFGVYLASDTTGKKIIIRSKYFVTKGLKHDSISAANGLKFWNRLSGEFLLVAMNDEMQFTGDTIPICFELSLHTSVKPMEEQDSNTARSLRDTTGWDIRNTFFLVDKIENKVRNCCVKDLKGTIGLTCGNDFIRILISHKEKVIVAAHEIGHTLGLEDRDGDGLMQRTYQGGTEVYRKDIKTILDHSSRYRLNIYRNCFDMQIPRGKIIYRPDRELADDLSDVLFLKPPPGTITD